jgi:hypothetical protein
MPFMPGVDIRYVRAPGAWTPLEAWYRAARTSTECLNPDTPQRVPGCWCTICRSRLTDPDVVGAAQ